MKSPLLIIAKDYTPMFKALIDRLQLPNPIDKPEWQRHAAKEISWAKQVLKKEDRIVWYLRLVRLDMVKQAEDVGVLPKGTLDRELKALSTKAGKPITKADVAWVHDEGLHRELQHFMGIEDRAIQEKQFGYETPEELVEPT